MVSITMQTKSCTQHAGQVHHLGAHPLIINAKYLTSNGEEKRSILLASGWWGVSRHFHYIPELLAALCSIVPALFNGSTARCRTSTWFSCSFFADSSLCEG